MDLDPIKLRQDISYCFQSPTLFGETVRDNLQFGYDIRNLDFDEVKAKELLGHVELPTSYLDKDISTLSGGEKQRVALIRNVQFRPDVLLLDEITSALDAHTQRTILAWLDTYRKENNVTIVMVSHNENEQNLADRTIELKNISPRRKSSIMSQVTVTPTSLILSFVLVLIALGISYREQLKLEQELLLAIIRMIVQLVAVGFLLQGIFQVDDNWLTLAMMLVMILNASWNAANRGKGIKN